MPGAQAPSRESPLSLAAVPSVPAVDRRSIWAVTPIVIVYWISGVILNYSNVWFLHAIPCPTLLAACQWGISAILVQPAKLLAPQAAASSSGTFEIILRVLPASMCYTASMVIGKITANSLSIGVIHLFGCTQAVIVYFMNCGAGIDELASSKIQALLMISVGIAFAGGGFGGATPLGLVLQLISTFAECGHAFLVGSLLSARGQKLDPFAVLSHFALVSTCCLAVVGVITELEEAKHMLQSKFVDEVGFGWVATNSVNFFVTELASVVMMYRTDAVTFTVFSLIRGMVLDGFGALALGAPVTIEELIGYIIALVGTQVFNLARTRPEDFDTLGSLLKGLLRSAQGLVFEVSAAQQKPADRAVVVKQAFNDELDGELDREMQLVAGVVGARSPPSRREQRPGTSSGTEFFEIGDADHGDDGEELLAPTGG